MNQSTPDRILPSIPKPENYLENVQDWDHVSFDEDGEIIWRVEADRMLGFDLERYELENVRIERGRSQMHADHGVWHKGEGVLILRDNVHADGKNEEGERLTLSAEWIKVIDGGDDGYSFTAEGTPVIFIYFDKGAEDARGQALRMEYRESDRMLMLIGDAELDGTVGYFSGEKLEYFIDED